MTRRRHCAAARAMHGLFSSLLAAACSISIFFPHVIFLNPPRGRELTSLACPRADFSFFLLRLLSLKHYEHAYNLNFKHLKLEFLFKR